MLKRLIQTFKTINSEWQGNFPDFEAAFANSTGYDADSVISKIVASTRQVRDGHFPYVRDSVLFDKVFYSWPLATALLERYLTDRELHVIDFGGGLGSSYFQNIHFLQQFDDFSWTVIEQEKLVQIGKDEFQTDRLRFCNSIQEANEKRKVNFILFSGVLQCLENPEEYIQLALKMAFPTILIDRTAFIEGNKERICIQNVPEEIYKGSYPSRFFVESTFVQYFKDEYTLLSDFSSYCDRNQLTDDGVPVYWKGFYFIRKK